MAESVVGIGERAPDFELPDTAGTTVGLPRPGQAPASVVVWTCNHCPYALAWHQRLQTVAAEYAPRGVVFLQINSNDAERYPADAPAAMRERVAAGEFAGPYLHDASQEVALAYGAEKTPHVFVLDSELCLAYAGAPDADYEDPSQDAAWLRMALDDVFSRRRLDLPQTKAVGCSIKWKSGS